MNKTEVFRGWYPTPDERGTIDIIWSCLFTIFLCTWTALHLNLPASHENYVQFALRKGKWFILTLLGPEFVVWLAIGQRYEAKDSMKKFKASGHDGWTLKHGFYAEMGGITVQATDCKPFPVTAKQLHYLVQQGYMELPKISKEEIWDKSKADLFTKILSCGQITWLVVQVVARLVQRLEITTLELTTLGYVLCALSTYLAWLHKPLDIEMPTVISLNTTMKHILCSAGSIAAHPYRQNPLDFVDNQGPSWWLNVHSKYFPFRVEPEQRPLPRITNDRFPNVGIGLEAVFYFLVSHGFAGIHLGGWYLHAFPTNVEKVLWRVSSVVMAGIMVIVWVLEGAAEQNRRGRTSRWRKKLSTTIRSRSKSGSDSSTQSGTADPLVKLKSRKEIAADPDFIPVWEFVAFIPVALIYSVARAYLMAETLAGLRALPVGAFKTVEWTNFLPHV